MRNIPACCAATYSEPSNLGVSKLSMKFFSEGGCQKGNVALAVGGWSSANTSEV